MTSFAPSAANRLALARHHRNQPVIGQDVVVENLSKLVIADLQRRAVIWVRGRIADERRDLAERAPRFRHQIGKVVLRRNVGRNRDRGPFAMQRVQFRRSSLAGFGLAA